MYYPRPPGGRHLRVSELSRIAGVPIPTIKYYLREGVLPPGRPTARNQADYDDTHVHRLRLIRVLRDVGGLPVAVIGQVLAAVEDETVTLHRALGVAHRALAAQVTGPPDDLRDDARREVDRFVTERGWDVVADAPARDALAAALASLWRLGWAVGAEVFTAYADAADQLAARDIEGTVTAASREAALERMVVGSVVFGRALLALRLLAQEHHSARRQGG